ncbi:MAG: efflux RND transporter periplasmic adaptor subunit [Proteobacteria bacterium]|nr:efflux RND transporter periplasmic adaptor subunit [Pseudomonadota bacterium]
MKKSTARVFIGVALFVLLGSIAYKHLDFLGTFLGFSKKDSKKEMEPVAVEAQAVVVRPFVTELVAVGNLIAHDSVILRPEIEGIISNILFDSGSQVKKGQTLYTLDDALAQAQLSDAKAELLLSQKNYSRAQTLSKQKFISGKDVDELFAKLEKAKAQVELAQVRLSKTVLQAPFEGYAGIIQHSRGAFVKAGEDLITIVALDPIKVDFHVGEEYLQRLQEGQKISIKVDGFDQIFEGEVEAIQPEVDVSGHSILVRGRIENHEAKLHPGLFATVTLTLNVVEDAILIPEDALETQGNEQFVYRIVDGVATQTPVTVGGFEDGMVHILDGLWSYDTVVTAGAIKISDGVPVRVVKGPKNLEKSPLSPQQIENAKALFKGEGKLPKDAEQDVLEGEPLLEEKAPEPSQADTASADADLKEALPGTTSDEKNETSRSSSSEDADPQTQKSGE